ncbi:MAG TPA: SUMF1/EgtB/PvdO family nonheme iron enzyme [Candidatus Tyrphobacter sp.]
MISDITQERAALCEAYEQNRRRTHLLFDLIAPEAYEDRPIPLRHPFVFYEGHIPAFSFSTLVRLALGGQAIDEELERLFERGIDPENLSDAAAATPPRWPARGEVQRFAEECDARVRDALRRARLDDPDNPRLVRAQSAHNIIEHEWMHHETLLYIVHRLPRERKRALPSLHVDGERPRYRRVTVSAGTATLGARRDAIPFGWDNEFEETVVTVPDFEIDADDVTNGDYLEFVKAGGEPPPFWRRIDGEWRLETLFDLITLPLAWPVYVTQRQATAYAQWKGVRLPTEAEYHRAAFGTPQGEERAHPWGDAPPDETRGNFGFARFDPVPVGSYPKGASAWGINDLIGNGWEWTSTPFAPLPGFRPMASYPVYSADFFDGEHFVIKGASPVTHAGLVRRSFRNWFRPDYPYVYATFRCVA